MMSDFARWQYHNCRSTGDPICEDCYKAKRCLAKVPVDTLLDINPPVSSKALLLLKLLYIEFGKALGFENWTQTEIINAIEENRRRGHVQLIRQEDGAITMRTTPTGAVEAWSQKLKNPVDN